MNNELDSGVLSIFPALSLRKRDLYTRISINPSKILWKKLALFKKEK